MSKVKKTNNKKGGISKRTISIACALVAVIAVICGITIFIGLGGNRLFVTGDVTTEEIKEKASKALEEHRYALLSLSIEETVADEGTTDYNYILSCDKESEEKSYLYGDSNEINLFQYWNKNDETDLYDIYIYDNDNEVWVLTSQESKPVEGDPWDILNNIDDYTLLEETQNWYGTDTECYVFEILGSTDEYAAMYEQLFIRKADYVPVGIVSYAVSDVDEDKVAAGDDLNIGEELPEGAEVEVPTYNECIQMYEVTFSNSDLKLFSAPDEYLSEDEYMEFISSKESGSDE